MWSSTQLDPHSFMNWVILHTESNYQRWSLTTSPIQVILQNQSHPIVPGRRACVTNPKTNQQGEPKSPNIFMQIDHISSAHRSRARGSNPIQRTSRSRENHLTFRLVPHSKERETESPRDSYAVCAVCIHLHPTDLINCTLEWWAI